MVYGEDATIGDGTPIDKSETFKSTNTRIKILTEKNSQFYKLIKNSSIHMIKASIYRLT